MQELSHQSRGEIRDLSRLKELYGLFVETLHQFVQNRFGSRKRSRNCYLKYLIAHLPLSQ